jgi:molybdopterin synthase catalytic subunit
VSRAHLTEAAIDLTNLTQEVLSPERGALVVFEGVVRCRHEGRKVVGIRYEAYAPLAEASLARIEAELAAAFPDLACAIVHRLGDLGVGEVSLAIVCASPHRQAAFDATRLALERVKREVPIWKLEHYEDGTSRWRTEELLVSSESSSPSSLSRSR